MTRNIIYKQPIYSMYYFNWIIHIIVGHINLLGSMLILIMRINMSHINFQPIGNL